MFACWALNLPPPLIDFLFKYGGGGITVYDAYFELGYVCSTWISKELEYGPAGATNNNPP